MSCNNGNRFQCGITRFQKHSSIPDKPSNQELHSENQKRLNELLKAREAQDNGIFTTNIQLSDNKSYTPWSIPNSSIHK
jgi:hypothetical protein